MAYNYGWNYKTFTNDDDSKYAGSVFTYANLSQARLGTVNVNVNTLNNMNGYAEVHAHSNDANCISAPMSGRPLYWDDILSFSADSDNPTPLFSIDYPYWENGKQKRHTLVVKAFIDSEVTTNRRIGSITPSVSCDYIYVHLYFYERRHMIPLGSEEEIPYDVRIGSGMHRCQVFKPNTRDVTDSVSYLEFFYASETQSDWDDNLHQVFVGISNRAVVGVGGSNIGICSYRLWAPNMYGESVNAYQHYFGLHNPNSVPYDMNYGYEAGIGGYGDANPTHDDHSDDIVASSLPTLSALSSGFVNAYKVTSGLLANLGQALFPSISALQPNNVVDAIVDFYNVISAMWLNSKSIDYILDCHIIPVSVPTGGNANITAGGRVLADPTGDHPVPYSAPVINTMYVTQDCGYVTTPEYFGNFLDYTVKCKLYLPCYGYVDIPAEYWNGGTIAVKYVFNIFDGSFVAMVYATAKHSKLNSLIGQYAGTACTHIPLNGKDYSTLIAGLMATAIGTYAQAAAVPATSQTLTNTLTTTTTSDKSSVSQVALGQVTNWQNDINRTTTKDQEITTFGTGAQSPCTALSGLGAVMGMKPGMVNNGSTNSSSSMMMHKKPYLIIEYPTPQFSSRYPKERGLPLNVSAPLGKYGGMTIAENPILDGISCTATEKEKIRCALLSGLIFR